MSANDNRKESFGIGAWNVDFHEPMPKAMGGGGRSHNGR